MATTQQVADFTRILNAAHSGDAAASHEVFTVIYHELRRLASGRMAREAAGHTLQPTALVHEAWLRLANPHAEWKNRAPFSALPAKRCGASWSIMRGGETARNAAAALNPNNWTT
jgi:hypothetical protein